MAKLVFHVDVNSTYLSWEAARRVANGEPDIRLIPSVIGGDREKRTGVVLAKSIPAKKFGIKTGEPIGMALRKCPDLYLAKPDFRLYEENSRKFMDICREYAPVVEKASIDECYLDMSGTYRIYPDPVALADSVTARIRADGAKAYCVAVTIRDNSFKTHSHQRSLMTATDISKEVYTISRELFDELWDGVTPLRLLGIALTNVTHEGVAQFSLFPDESREKARKIDIATDALNAKFGSSTIVRGSSIQSKLDVGKKYKAQMELQKTKEEK